MTPEQLGHAIVHLTKSAADATLSYGLTGQLQLSRTGWLVLKVPNAIGHGAFQALNEPGVEMPLSESLGHYNAHISVMRPSEVEQLGGPDKIKERGKNFSFTLGPVRSVNPAGWEEMSKAWFISVRSPELMKLRKAYGLDKPKYPFHLTFAVKPVQRRKSASFIHFTSPRYLGTDSRKAPGFREKNANVRGVEIKESPIDGKGLFATRDYREGEVILPRMMTKMDGEFSLTRYEQSEESRFTNHADEANAEVVREEGDAVNLVAARDITKGEEITGNYDKTTSVLGPGFYFTYQGRNYNGESSADKDRDREDTPGRVTTTPDPPPRDQDFGAGPVGPDHIAPEDSDGGASDLRSGSGDTPDTVLTKTAVAHGRGPVAGGAATVADHGLVGVADHDQSGPGAGSGGPCVSLLGPCLHRPLVHRSGWRDPRDAGQSKTAGATVLQRAAGDSVRTGAGAVRDGRGDPGQPPHTLGGLLLKYADAMIPETPSAASSPLSQIAKAVGFKDPESENATEEAKLERAVQRNLREREARRIAAQRDELAETFEKVGAKNCPGCGNKFKKDEPYPDVKMCEVCERFGPPKLIKEGRSLAQDIATARRKTKTPASEAQAEAGNYPKGKVNMHGLTIAIETGKGQTRSGTDRNGKKWSITMKHDYGDIKRTTAADGDSVDVFIGRSPDTELVFVVDQSDGEGKFDEHKCMLGFNTEEEAREGYLANYQKGWDRILGITSLTVPQFKWWLKNGNLKKPCAKQKTVKVAGANWADRLDNLIARRGETGNESHYVNALNQVPFTWDQQRGVARGLLDHLGAVKSRGDRSIQEAANFERLQNAMNPNRSLGQLSSYMDGRRQPVVSNPIDQFIHG